MVIAWRVAKCLDQLLKQVNAEAPDRSIMSDGSIGDDAHRSRTSDHNPWVGPVGGLWIVTARDFTHDPAGGFDAYEFAEILKARKDPRVKYVISNWRIWSLARDAEGWRPYAGPNGHTHHTHVSCTYNPALFDRTTAWNLTPPATSGATSIPPEYDDMVDPEVKAQLDRIEQKLSGHIVVEAGRYKVDADRYAEFHNKLNQILDDLAADPASPIERVA